MVSSIFVADRASSLSSVSYPQYPISLTTDPQKARSRFYSGFIQGRDIDSWQSYHVQVSI